jgi:hypothetical protein
VFDFPQQRVLANTRHPQRYAVSLKAVKMAIEKKRNTRPDCDGSEHSVAILETAIQDINGLPWQTVDKDTCRIQARLRTKLF